MNKPPSANESIRMTFDQMNDRYGFKFEDQIIDGKLSLHPVYKKHLNSCWVIENIYGHVHQVNCSLGKARELTSAVIEEAVQADRKAANESVVERLIDLHMKLNLATTPEAMTEIRNEVKQLIKELTASEKGSERE